MLEDDPDTEPGLDEPEPELDEDESQSELAERYASS